MAARHVFAVALGIAFSTSLCLSPFCFALDREADGADALPQVDNAKFQFVGRINSNAVFVRSGPSNNFYPAVKLDKGAEVKVVGIKYDWLKIVPPEGSFSYVPQAYVDRRGDGKIGRVNSPLNVRAGSLLNQMKTTVQVKLDEGQDVQIIGPQDEYYKIVPPEGAYLYVNKQYVDPVRRDDPGQPEIAAKPAPDSATPDTQPEAAGNDEPVVTKVPEKPEAGVAEQAVAESDKAATEDASATQPAVVAEDFHKLEADFEAASQQPVVDQPIEQLTERYTTLAKSGTLTGTSKRIVDARLVALKMRDDARTQLLSFRKSQEAMRERQHDLQIEQQEIDERVKQTQVALYSAVGTLRVSSIQQGQTTLYRLTDPATGRTIVYLRTNDPKFSGLLNQFVGVRGDVTSDERLRMRIITPTDAEAVDAAKVNSTVIATITPPSMLPTASTSIEVGN